MVWSIFHKDLYVCKGNVAGRFVYKECLHHLRIIGVTDGGGGGLETNGEFCIYILWNALCANVCLKTFKMCDIKLIVVMYMYNCGANYPKSFSIYPVSFSCGLIFIFDV